MDSDDAEGAELPPIDAKNIAGAGTKRRVDRAHDPSRLTHGVRGAGASAAALAGAELPPVDAEEKNMSGAGKKRRVDATANTHGETNGAAATYVTPPRPRPPHTHTPTLPPSRQSSPPSSSAATSHPSVAIVRASPCVSLWSDRCSY